MPLDKHHRIWQRCGNSLERPLIGPVRTGGGRSILDETIYWDAVGSEVGIRLVPASPVASWTRGGWMILTGAKGGKPWSTLPRLPFYGSSPRRRQRCGGERWT